MYQLAAGWNLLCSAMLLSQESLIRRTHGVIITDCLASNTCHIGEQVSDHMQQLPQGVNTNVHRTPHHMLLTVALSSLQQPCTSSASVAWKGSWLEGAPGPRTTCVRGCITSGDATFSAFVALWPEQMDAQCTAAS